MPCPWASVATHASPALKPPTTELLLPATAKAAAGSDRDHAALRLNKADVTLFQALGDSAQRRPCLVQYSGNPSGNPGGDPSGGHSGRRHVLQDSALVLGRSPECDICLESAGISRRHAELREKGDIFVLQDLGSSNGTHLNDHRITGPTPVKDGDLVRVGDVVFKFHEPQGLDALLHDRIYRLATLDSGTGLYTKRYLLDALEREFTLARRAGRHLSVLCMDLDHFKVINDRHGHNAGNEVLRGVAAAAKAAVRCSDIIGRTGSEAFAFVLPDTELRGAIDLAERVRLAVSERAFDLPLPGAPKPLRHRQTASVGAAQLAPAMFGARNLLGAADAMLYSAKRDGRNCVRA